jgi:hypothetical protein
MCISDSLYETQYCVWKEREKRRNEERSKKRYIISYTGRRTAPSSECKALLSNHLLPKMLASFIIDH